MPTLVVKFGGSSTANAGCLRQVAAILGACPARRCAVLSAPGTDAAHREKVTALLAECWRRDPEAVEAVARRFGEISKELNVYGFYALAKREILEALEISEAHTLSRGEYLCAKLFSEYTGLPFVDASEAVRFGEGGTLDNEATLERFRELSKEHARVIVPGFYGADASGRICLFPRNGSDITGALAAAGMGAGLYENWTDVPGLMTADPAIVPQAQLIPQVSYRQMRALSRAGAQVLHPACLDPVALAGIPTRLRNTLQPESFGTLIDERVQGTAPCIAGKRGEASARISVFGIGQSRVVEAAKGLHLEVIEADREGTVLEVENERYAECVRWIHRRLIG